MNDQAINAFALPGGPVDINRGVIEAADNEAQLAGVMAHEIAHVALCHGTTQATKASAAQLPLAILGGVIGRRPGHPPPLVDTSAARPLSSFGAAHDMGASSVSV